jgi:hypothetical protein
MWRDLPIDPIGRSPIARWAPVPLRLIGYGFMEHGFAKLARGLDASRQFCKHSGCLLPTSWAGSLSRLRYSAA